MEQTEYCKNTAMEWYDTILNEGPGFDKYSFYSACICRLSCVKLKKFDEAIQYFDKAGAIGTPFCDE